MQRLKGLDGIRGILALSVALSHAFGHYTGWRSGLYPIHNAAFAVDLFFVLSGIVLYHVHHEGIANNNDGFFYIVKKRILRLYPMHLFGMLLVPVCLLISTGVAYPEWIGSVNIKNIFGDSILMNAIGVGFTLSSNQPSWSISVELYIGTLIAFACCKYRLVPYLLAVLAVLLSYKFAIKSGDIDQPVAFLVNGGIVRCLFSMSIGVIAYRFIVKYIDYFRKNRLLSTLAGLGGFLLMLVTVWTIPTPFPTYFLMVIILSFSIAIIGLIGVDKLNFLDSRPLAALGKQSFSIYLLHTPLLYLFLFAKSGNNYFNSLLAVSVIILTVFLSRLTYRFIEKPFLKIQIKK